MSENEEEEVVQTSSSGRPNSYWAQVRARQELESVRETGYGGNFRGVPTPKSGTQRVRAEETTGSYDECWCGLPADHDWPGKDKGRKHPRKESKVTSVPTDETPHIDRRLLRAYHEDLIDVVVRAVNDYGVRYRIRPAGVLLYPPDGSTPVTVHARNTDRQVKTLRKWFLNHVVGFDESKGHALAKNLEPLKEDFDLRQEARRLAEKLNSEEHEPEAPENRRRRKAQEARDRAAKHEAAVESAEATQEAPAPAPEPPAPVQTEPIDSPEAEERAHEEFHVSESIPEGWRIFVGKSSGRENEHFITDGNLIRCRVCGWETTNAQVIGPHYGTNHDEGQRQRMYGPEGRKKMSDSQKRVRQEKSIKQGLEQIARAIGVELGDLDKLAKVTKERDEWRAKYEDVKARLDLMKEALRA